MLSFNFLCLGSNNWLKTRYLQVWFSPIFRLNWCKHWLFINFRLAALSVFQRSPFLWTCTSRSFRVKTTSSRTFCRFQFRIRQLASMEQITWLILQIPRNFRDFSSVWKRIAAGLRFFSSTGAQRNLKNHKAEAKYIGILNCEEARFQQSECNFRQKLPYSTLFAKTTFWTNNLLVKQTCWTARQVFLDSVQQ